MKKTFKCEVDCANCAAKMEEGSGRAVGEKGEILAAHARFGLYDGMFVAQQP